MIIKDSDGAYYYAVIGIDGEFLFDPVRVSDQINEVFDPDGYHLEIQSTAGTGYFVVIGNDGKVHLETDYVNDFSVKNGVIHFIDDGLEAYVDTRATS